MAKTSKPKTIELESIPKPDSKELIVYDELTKLAKAKIDEKQALALVSKFKIFSDSISDFKAKAVKYEVTSVTQTDLMQKNAEAYELVKGKLKELEDLRKSEKDFYLRSEQAIDGVARVLRGYLEPIADQLLKSAMFKENLEKQRKKELTDARMELLKPYEVLIDPAVVGDMSDDVWENYLAITIKNYEERVAEQKAEAAKKMQEEIETRNLQAQLAKEITELKKENEKLQTSFQAIQVVKAPSAFTGKAKVSDKVILAALKMQLESITFPKVKNEELQEFINEMELNHDLTVQAIDEWISKL